MACATLHYSLLLQCGLTNLYVALTRRAGTIALAGDLGGLQISNTGTGTIYTSGVSAAAATAVSGSGRTIVLPSSGKALCVNDDTTKQCLQFESLPAFLPNVVLDSASIDYVVECCRCSHQYHTRWSWNNQHCQWPMHCCGK